MDPHEWAEIERLFDLALLLPAEERRAWADQVCEGYPERRETLLRLIRKFNEPSRDLRDENPIFAPGQLVAGRFRVVELIACGGMGEVYKVRDEKLHNMHVALKTIRPDVSSDKAALERFLREVWVPREIADDGICRMYELVEHRQLDAKGTETTIPCLTMQFLEGETLAALVSRQRPLPLAGALAIAGRVGRSLQALHDNGIIHRDLKPSNVMLIPKPEGGYHPVIIDFGLAKRQTAMGDVWDTQSAPLPGAPYFLAPEVLSGKPGSVASDIYSFGLLIDTLVTSRNAYAYSSLEELMCRKVNEEPEPPGARSEGLPAVWEAAILACLRRDPAQRPKRAAEIVKLLEGDADATPLPEVAGVPAGWRALIKKRMTRRTMIGVASTVGVAISGATIAALTAPPLEGAILIFPFRNLTTRPEFDQLCLGTESELIRRLRSIPGLQIFPVPKNWKLDKTDLARGQFSLDGSLQVNESSPYFKVRLTDNVTGSVAAEWKTAAAPTNPVGLQSEIGDRTVEGLRLGLSSNRVEAVIRMMGGSSLPRQATVENAALVEYQKAEQLSLARTPASALEAIACYERAIAHDPKYALAHAALADIRQVLLLHNRGATRHLLDEALAYAEKAVELDGSLPECHVSLASARQNVWDWEAADRSYQAALRANRRYPRANMWYGGLILQFGRMQEALGWARKGLDQAPFDDVEQASYGLYLWFAGQSREAAAHLEKLAQRSGIINAYINLGQAYATLARESQEPEASGYFSQSIAAASEVRARELASAGGIDPGYLKWSDLIFNQAHVSRGDLNAARYCARRMEKGMEAGHISASAVARAYAMVDDRRKALELLDAGKNAREREMLYLVVHPLYRNLHRESGFWRLAREMRLS